MRTLLTYIQQLASFPDALRWQKDLVAVGSRFWLPEQQSLIS